MGALRHRGFLLLWSSQLVSNVGDMVLFVALPFYVYARTGSSLATGGIFVAETLPRFLGPFGGVLVDRWDRRRTMIRVDVVRAVVLLPMLLVSKDTIWIVYVVAIIESILAQVFFPASSALVPALVPKDQLPAANAAMSSGFSTAQLMGPPLGGLLLGVFGLPAIILADSLSFALSALGLAAIRTSATATVAPAMSRFTTELREGLHLIGRSGRLIGLMVLMGLLSIGNGIVNVLLVPFIRGLLGFGAAQFGALLSIQAFGAIAGTLVLGSLAARWRPRPAIAINLVIAAVLMLAMSQARPFWAVGLLLFAIGPVATFAGVMLQTVLQVSVADRHRGRLFGVVGSVSALGAVIGMVAAALLTDHIAVVGMFMVASATFVVAAATALSVLRTSQSISTEEMAWQA